MVYLGDSRLGSHIAVSALRNVKCTVFIQIKHMIQSSARNLILKIYVWIQLSTVQVRLIQFSAIPGTKHLSRPSQFIARQQRAIMNNFRYPINVLLQQLKEFLLL